MKNIIVTVVVTLIIAATISALSIVSYKAVTDHSEPTPQPDRVVAVLAKCQFWATDHAVNLTGSQCQQVSVSGESTSVINSHLQLTVRTPQGTTYQIDVPANTKVAVGDAWPK